MFVSRGDPHDMAAAFATPMIVNEQEPRVRLPACPDDCRDRAKTGEAAPGEVTRGITALQCAGLANVVVIPTRGAVGEHGFSAGVVVLAGNDIAAGGAVK